MEDKPKILLVFADQALFSLCETLQSNYEVIITHDCFEALRILHRERIHVILADKHLPIISGSSLLRQARSVSPHTTRILLAGYDDAEQLVDTPTTDGDIFGYYCRDWSSTELYEALVNAVEFAKQLEARSFHPTLQRKPQVIEPIVVPTVELVDHKRLICVVLDHDEKTYLVVKEVLEPSHNVLWIQDTQSALSILESKSIAIMITELSFGAQDIKELLTRSNKNIRSY